MLWHGILSKAFPMIACYVIVDIFARALFSYSLPILFWFVFVPLSVAWGLIWAWLNWSKNEERFKR
jgi:hypothetical protein